MVSWTRRGLLVAAGGATLAGCLGSDDDDAEGGDDDSGEPTLSGDDVDVELSGETVTIESFGEASEVALQSMGGIQTHYTLVPEDPSVEPTPGHYRVVSERDPEDPFEETELGFLRAGELAFDVSEDWESVATRAENVSVTNGTLTPADPNRQLEWEYEPAAGEPVTELFAAHGSSDSGQFHVTLHEPPGENFTLTVPPRENLTTEATEPAAYGRTDFAGAEPYMLTVTTGGDGSPVSIDRIGGVTTGPVTVIDG